MHWNDQYASQGRVGAVVNPVTDPWSGQPESKHTPVSIRPVKTAWEGLLLTRSGRINPAGDYWSRSRFYDHWCYDIAGVESPADWSARARQWLPETAQHVHWLEYNDTGTGHYRAARIENGILEACLFIAPHLERLPDRNWLQDLFREQLIDEHARACLLAGRPVTGAGDQGPVVCSCFFVRQNTIIQTILKNNIIDVKEIGILLGAGTNCGSCIPEVRQLLQNNSMYHPDLLRD